MSSPQMPRLTQAYANTIMPSLSSEQQFFQELSDMVTRELAAVMGDLFVGYRWGQVNRSVVHGTLDLIEGASLAVRYYDTGTSIEWTLSYEYGAWMDRGPTVLAHTLPMTASERHYLHGAILKVALHR